MKSKNGLRQFAKQLEKISDKDINVFCEKCTMELAARFLAKAIKRTPVGKGSFEVVKDDNDKVVKYKKGKKAGQVKRRITQGGVLRRGWTSINKIKVKKIGATYQVTITNSVKYASYVEYGHRQTPGRYVPAIGKKLKAGWVNGVYMMTFAAAELERESPLIIEQRLAKFLKGALHVK